MNSWLIVLIVLILILVWMYNALISKKNQVENIFASVDTLLKKRYDLIPNLVASVKKYMEHEQTLLRDVTQLRADANKAKTEHEKIAIDAKMSDLLGSLMISVEAYPELKANQNVQHLQHSLNEVEEQISAARRAYNQAVTDYNNAIEMVPTNIMAKFMNYQRKEVFAISEQERKNVNVEKLFQ